MRTKSTQNVIWKPTEPSSLKLSVSEARLWSAGSPCLQWRHSSIIEGCFTNERRSTPSPSVTVFLAIISFLLVSIPLCSPSHCLACSRMWSERRTCQCYQHATDDSFEGDRDFQLLPLRLITHTPRWVDPTRLFAKQTTKLWAAILHVEANGFLNFAMTLTLLMQRRSG